MPTQDFFHRFIYALADIHKSLDLNATEEAVTRNAALMFGARGASLMLFDPTGENLVVSATFGLSDAYRAKGAISPRKSLGETIKGGPVVVRDVQTDPNVQYREAAFNEGIKGIVGVPLAAGTVMVGSLRLYFAQSTDFSPEEMEYLKFMAQHAGLALKKAFFFTSMRDSASEIHSMPTMDSLKDALKTLCQSAARYGHALGCALLLVSQEHNTLGSVISFGLSERYLAKGPLSVGLSLGEVATGKPVVISSVANDPRVQYKKEAAAENVKAIIGLPVRAGNEVAGALRLYYPYEFEPDQDDVMWMEYLALQAGMALEKNRYLIQLKDKHDWYVEVLRDLER